MCGPLRAESQVINEGSTVQRGLFRSTKERDKGGRRFAGKTKVCKIRFIRPQ